LTFTGNATQMSATSHDKSRLQNLSRPLGGSAKITLNSVGMKMAASAEPVCRANASELMASVCRTARRLFSPPERCAFPADPTNSRVLEAWWTRVVSEPRASSLLLPNTLELLRAFLDRDERPGLLITLRALLHCALASIRQSVCWSLFEPPKTDTSNGTVRS
jgi:hypothetical protein